MRMLFIDYSSAFNTIVPLKLVTKLRDLGLNIDLRDWILNCLMGRPQAVRIGSTISCVATHSSNAIIKFADDTTVIGLITGDDEKTYREEVRALTSLCQDNNLHLNVGKRKELIVDYRKRQGVEHTPLAINRTTME